MEGAPLDTAPARTFMDAMEQFWLDSLAGFGTAEPTVEKFLAAATPRVEAIFPFLDDSAAVALERLLKTAFEGTEWERVCRMRSAMAAFDETFLPRFEDGDEGMEDEELDEEIREKGETEGGLEPDLIPAGTDKSHWWWFL